MLIHRCRSVPACGFDAVHAPDRHRARSALNETRWRSEMNHLGRNFCGDGPDAPVLSAELQTDGRLVPCLSMMPMAFCWSAVDQRTGGRCRCRRDDGDRAVFTAELVQQLPPRGINVDVLVHLQHLPDIGAVGAGDQLTASAGSRQLCQRLLSPPYQRDVRAERLLSRRAGYRRCRS